MSVAIAVGNLGGPSAHGGYGDSAAQRRRVELREFGSRLSDHGELAGCGRTIRKGRGGSATEILEVTTSCRRKWLCPTCGYTASRKEAATLTRRLLGWTAEGGAVALLTLTQRHCPDDGLAPLWSHLEAGWAALVRGSGWIADKRAFGVGGYHGPGAVPKYKLCAFGLANTVGAKILVAESTAVLLTGVDLVDLGPRRLRDLPNPITVFQLQAPGLRTDFPSLRGVDSNPGNLRPAITSLIGRDAEVANLQAALRSHRLVTLAGVGKTRLAVEVATQVADEFVDGVWFFELAAVADPAAVPDAVAAVLGITQQPGKSVSESVASALEGRSRLLVFDNCEHVVDSVADLVAAILAASATVKVLATSREGIGVADEFLWRVPSLDVGAAVELFVERAQSMVSDTLADEASAVEDVCRRLDGIPLAIELAASRMASMTAAEVRDRLDDRFKLLVGSRRGLERHQTLRHAVA